MNEFGFPSGRSAAREVDRRAQGHATLGAALGRGALARRPCRRTRAIARNHHLQLSFVLLIVWVSKAYDPERLPFFPAGAGPRRRAHRRDHQHARFRTVLLAPRDRAQRSSCPRACSAANPGSGTSG